VSQSKLAGSSSSGSCPKRPLVQVALSGRAVFTDGSARRDCSACAGFPDAYAVMSAWIATYFRGERGFLVIQQEAGAASPQLPAAVPASCFSNRIQSEFGEAFGDYCKQNVER
jgi:hypothetical protein